MKKGQILISVRIYAWYFIPSILTFEVALVQMQSLRRELSAGLRPLHETFVALIRLFGSKGYATRGLEILAAMEKLNFDIRKAWLVLVGTMLCLTQWLLCFQVVCTCQ